MNDTASGSRSPSGTSDTPNCADRIGEPDYGGPLRRHVDDGDLRLLKLRMDNSAASLRLWNFLLSEEDRLRCAEGKRLVGTMKDLGTVPVMAYSLTTSWRSIPTAPGGCPA